MIDSDTEEDKMKIMAKTTRPMQTEERHELTAEETKELLKAYGGCLELESGDIRVSCTGGRDSDQPPPFDYIAFQSYRRLKMKLEEFERRRRIKNALRVEQVEDYTKEKLSAKMQIEFGPMDTFSAIYKGYFESYENASLSTLTQWMKKEKKLKQSKSNESYKNEQEETKEKMDQLLKFSPSFKNFGDFLHLQCVDWLEFPRPNFSRIDARNTSFIDKVIANGCKVVTGLTDPQLDADLTVSVLPDTEKDINLIFLDPMVAFSSEILFDKNKISDDEARQLKSVMNSFPNGVTPEEYLNTFKEAYGKEPNYHPFGTFVDMCENLDDIFLFSDEIVPGRRLLFPSYWLGLLKPMNVIMQQAWHWVKFIINFNGGTIFCDQILPKMMDIFELQIKPTDWGFGIEENFFQYLLTKFSTEDYYTLCYVCPHYANIRKRYITPFRENVEISRQNYLDQFRNLTPQQAIRFYLFLKLAIKTRNFISNY